MEENVAVASAGPSITSESGLFSQIIEEGPRVCPLCSSEVRLFFIHLNEKLLMCVNTECDFPFGYEELQFVRVEQGEETSDTVSLPSHKLLSPSSSVVSATCVSDIEKLNKVYDADNSLLEPKMLNNPINNPKKVNKKIIAHRESEKQIKKNVEDLKELTMELNDRSTKRKTIQNQKWIKNLMKLQDHSGFKLLKPQELKKLSENEDVKRELKIDIEPGSSGCVSSIKIKIGQVSSQSEVT